MVNTRIRNGVKSKHSYFIIMASGLEQTHRNFRVPYPFKHFRFLFHVLEIFRSFRPSTTWGSGGLDRESDCGSDRTGIFAFSAEELFWEKLFLIMTQVARNKKSEFLRQESNLWHVWTSNRFDSDFFFRAALRSVHTRRQVAAILRGDRSLHVYRSGD